MRLTLRNLLRFLDQTTLGPLERERLEELVENSDRAAAWIQRIKTLRTDPAKSAPSLGGEPTAARVASYLDGSLSEQEIVEFEEAMLASDEILAEVASAHLVVQQLPAADAPSIPVVLRQTLYDLDRVYGESASNGGENTATSDDPDIATSMEDLPFVDASEPDPDSSVPLASEVDAIEEEDDHAPPVSLDSMKRRANGRSILVAAMVVGLLAGAFGFTYWLGRESVRLSQPARVTNPEVDSDPESADPANSGDGETANPTTTDPGQPDNNEKRDPDDGDTGDTADPPAVANEGTGQTEPPGDEAASLVADQPQPPAADTAEPESDEIPPRPDISAPVAAAPAPFVGPLLPPRVVARSPESQILALLRTPGSDELIPITSSIDVREGDHIQVLAGMTAELEFGDKMRLFATGPAAFSFGNYDPDDKVNTLVLEFGEVSVVSNEADIAWAVQIGESRFRITMLLAESMVHAQALRYLPPGIDPRQVEPATLTTIATVEGRARLKKGEQSWTVPKGNAVVEVLSAIPEIASAPQTGVIEEPVVIPRYMSRLSDIVGHNLRTWKVVQRDVIAELLDLKGDSRQEIRLAALTWLAEQGNFDFVMDFFGDSSNKSNWRTFVEALRHTIRNRPEFANRLFESLEFAGPENQPKLYGLILGFGPEDLQSGLDAKLVEYLNDPNLEVRVLAIENLRQITGGVTYGYLPTKNQTLRRRVVVRQWEPRLKKGDIRYAEQPAMPLTKLSPAPPTPDDSGLDKIQDSDPGN